MVQHTEGYVLPVPRVTLHHLIGWLKAGIGDFHDGQLLMVSLLGLITWPGGSGCEGTAPGWFGTLSDRHWKTVGVCGTLYFQVISADIIDGLAVHHESAVRVVEGGVCGHCPAGIPIHDPLSMPLRWWYTAPSIVPLMRCSCPVLLAEKYPHNFHLRVWRWGWCFWGHGSHIIVIIN